MLRHVLTQRLPEDDEDGDVILLSSPVILQAMDLRDELERHAKEAASVASTTSKAMDCKQGDALESEDEEERFKGCERFWV